MKKESDRNMKIIVSNPSEIDKKSDEVNTLEKSFQSDPIKVDLYSKLLAFKNSQRKFSVKDLIKDNLK